MLRVGFISLEDPRNRTCFSGTLFYMHRALDALAEIEVVVLGQRLHGQTGTWYRAARFVSRHSKRFRRFMLARSQRRYAQAVRTELESANFDFLVAPVASGVIARLSQPLPPLLFVTDATPGFLREGYRRSPSRDHVEDERATVSIADRVVYSSDFMAARARTEFAELLDNDPRRVCVVPFGLNMDDAPEAPPHKHLDAELRLIFVGADWPRKGGDIALEALKHLRQSGVNAHLWVIGSSPIEALHEPGVTVIPYLNKILEADRKRYFELLSAGHFLLLPTQADCTPMVIAEANAFGMPALTTNVGGIPTLVQDGENGFLLPPSATGEAYAAIIRDLFEDTEKYVALSAQSRLTFSKKLNWAAWADEILALGRELGAD
jgi:glycosyltransferase involved in cell wall biosynthesis